MTNTLDNYPFVQELHEEFYHHKKILSEWHENNNYGDINNETPYPRDILFRMIDLLEIIDNVYSYSPDGGEDYKIVRSQALERGFST